MDHHKAATGVRGNTIKRFETEWTFFLSIVAYG